MSNSAIALVFLSDFRFVVMVTETTKLGLEHRHCRVKAKKNPKARINKLQCRAGSYCQIHGGDDTVQQFKVQFQWSVCPTLRSVQEPGGVEDGRSSLRLRGGAMHGGTVPTGCKNSEYSLWVHDAAHDGFGHPAGFVHKALVEPGGRAPGASP